MRIATIANHAKYLQSLTSLIFAAFARHTRCASPYSAAECLVDFAYSVSPSASALTTSGKLTAFGEFEKTPLLDIEEQCQVC